MYLNLKKSIARFNKSEKQFVTIIGKSFFIIPYTIHNATPSISATNITIDKSSTFFSLIIFINCGSSDDDVKMPATMPRS